MKVGTRVKVINVGQVYDTHPDHKEYGAINFIRGKSPNNGDIGIVLATPLINRGTKGVVVRIKDIDFIISQKGVMSLKEPRTATLEIYKTKKGLSYRKIASNGKILNHQYNTMAGLKKGIEAEKRFWENYKIVTK